MSTDKSPYSELSSTTQEPESEADEGVNGMVVDRKIRQNFTSSLSREELLVRFAKEQTARKWLQPIRVVIWMCPSLLSLFLFVMKIQNYQWLIIFFIVVNFILTIFMSHFRSWSGRQLSNYEDIQLTGTFIEMLAIGDIELLPKVRRVLTNLLPQMKASDSTLIDAQQKELLLSVLTNNRRVKLPAEYIAFQLAILKSLEQIGDLNDLQTVTEIATSKGKSYDERVRETAIECLPYLQIRASKVREKKELLRASSFSDSPEHLLRPATHPGETKTEELLRSSGVEAVDLEAFNEE